MSEPDCRPGSDTARVPPAPCRAPKILLQRLDRCGQNVGDHGRREGVPVVWRIAPSDTGRVDRHDEIPSCRQMPGHAEGTLLARHIEIEVLTVDPSAGDAHPQQGPRTGILRARKRQRRCDCSLSARRH